MKPERIQWKRTKRRNQLLLDKILLPKNFPATRWRRLPPYSRISAIITDVAKPKAIEAFGNVYDETRDELSPRNQ